MANDDSARVPERGLRRWLLHVLVGTCALVIAVALLAAKGQGTTDAAAAPDAAVDAARTAEASTAEASTTSAAPATTLPSKLVSEPEAKVAQTGAAPRTGGATTTTARSSSGVPSGFAPPAAAPTGAAPPPTAAVPAPPTTSPATGTGGSTNGPGIPALNLSGPVYYVDPAGNDAAGGGSGDPWRSLPASVAKLKAGDTLLVRTGDYSPVNAHLSGTSGAWITIAAEPGNSPRIAGANTNELFLIADSQYVDLRGFELAGSPDDHSNTGGVAIDRSHHVRVSNLKVHDVPSGGISAVSSSHVQIERNTVWNTSFWSGYATSGISLYQGANSGGANGDGFTDYVRNNVVYGVYNKVNSQFDGTHTDGNCIIIDRHNDTNYGGATLIQNNLCHDNGGRGVAVFMSGNVTAVNNTVINNNLDPVIGNAGAGELSALYSSNVVFRNNLVVAGGGHRIMLFQASGVTLDSNLYVGAPEHGGSNDIVVADPGLASYRPQAGSAAIDAGSATAAPSSDIRGVARRGAPDIGAYES
jgi:hypothetical protein